MQNPLTSPLRFVSCEDSKQKLAALRHYWMKADSRWQEAGDSVMYPFVVASEYRAVCLHVFD